MARRYRRRPRYKTHSAQIIQIVGLTLVLVMVLLFRDEIAGGAGALFGDMGSEDVSLPEETEARPDGDPSTTPGSSPSAEPSRRSPSETPPPQP